MNTSPARFGLSMLAASALLVSPAFAQSPGTPGMGAGASDSMALARMSHEATHILDDVAFAQNAITAGNTSLALHDIHMAIMTRNHLAMTARSHNLPKIVPIYSEMEQSTALGAVVAQENKGRPMPPMKEPVAVDSVSGQFTFVGLDLDKTKAKLQSALASVQGNNMQAAQQELGRVGDLLVVGKVDSEAPLLAIRENLGIAQLAVQNRHEKEATAALQQAGVELDAYAQQGGAQHQQAAQMLKTGIDHMLSMNGQRSMAAANRIGGWWAEVNSWMQGPPAA